MRLSRLPLICVLALLSAHSHALAGWAILFDKGGLFTRNIPDEAFRKLGELANQGSELKGITFTRNGWAILCDKNGYYTRNIPDEAFRQLGVITGRGAALKCLTFTMEAPPIQLSQ